MAKRKALVMPESESTPYEQAAEDAASHHAAIEMYNHAPPDRCPFKRGTPEEAEYDRGWKATMERFAAEDYDEDLGR
jgi:hypothetical protein